MELHVIFGTGPVGTGVARLVLGKGHKVRMINRSGRMPDLLSDMTPGEAARLEVRAADVMDLEAARRAAAGSAFIYNCANVSYEDWHRVLPVMSSNLIEAAREAGALLAYAENLYMYARGTATISEDTPIRPPSRKGVLRQRLHQELVEAGVRHGLGWTTVRASDFYGPGATGQSVFGTQRFLDPLYAGRKPAMIGDPDQPHTYTYVGDYSRALVEAASRPAAHGKAWIVPNDRTVSTRQVARMFFEAARRKGGLSRIPRGFIATAGLFSPLLREVVEVLHQKEEPYVVDGSRFQSLFSFTPTPLEEGVRRTVAWYESRRR